MPTQEEVIKVLENIGRFVSTHPFERILYSMYEGLNINYFRIQFQRDDNRCATIIFIEYYDLANNDLSVIHRVSIPEASLRTNRILPIMTRPEAGLITPEEFRLLRQSIEFRLTQEQITGLRPIWWRFNEVMSTPNYESKQPHPPYPLIGLEYEPQLTLLNYPKKSVFIVMDNKSIVVEYFRTNCVVLTLPYKYCNNRDQDNLEFRTPPVKFENLPEEIAKLQTEMESLIKEIAKVVGPVGIFLPAQPCTKHINLSGLGKPVTRKDAEVKLGNYGNRYHLKVPYSFTDYNHIATTPFYYFLQKKPILLGYSMTGDSFVRRCELP